MPGNDVKSFHDLEHEIQDRGICGRCGGCVTFCSSGELNALRYGPDGMPEFADEKKCLSCGICYMVCPQVKVMESELKEKLWWQPPIGQHRSISSTKTTKPDVASLATDGGVVTSLVLYALENHVIDGAVVAKKTGPFTREPVVATSAQEVIDAAGSHYDEVDHLGEVGRSHTFFVPAIRQVGKLKRQGLKKIAMIGTPCQVYSLRKMQVLNVVPADIVSLSLGLFCMESFSFDNLARKRLEKQVGASLKKVAKINIKDDVILTLASGASIHVPFDIVDSVARPACFACADFSNEYADISFGGVGSPDYYTTVITRTPAGESLYKKALRDGFIEEMDFNDGNESKLHRTEAMAKLVSFSQRKKERAERVLGGA